jgi:hypothetical protein
VLISFRTGALRQLEQESEQYSATVVAVQDIGWKDERKIDKLN